MSFTIQEFELPSKGLIYPPESPLRRGKVKLHPMTAVEEDLITDPNITSKGVSHIADVLLDALMIDKVNADDLLEGDRNSLLIDTRIVAWGSMLEFDREHPVSKKVSKAKVDLSTVEQKPLTASPIKDGVNEFDYQFPYGDQKITFKLLTRGDYRKLDEVREELKKVDDKAHNKTTLLDAIILSVEGDYTPLTKAKLIQGMFAADIRAFLKYVDSIKPDTLLKADITYEDGYVEGGVKIPFVEWDTFLPDWREDLFTS